jgi:hypothetical protein
MITDSEVGLRDRGLVTIGGALGLLERGLSNGGADRSDADNRKSDGNRGPNEQLRDAAWHDSLHPCQLHGGQSTSSEILTPVTDVTGSDDISDAYSCARLWGLGHAGPHRHQIAGPGGNLPSGATYCRHGLIHSASVVPKSGGQRRGVVSVGRICSGVDVTTAHTRGRHARGARSI